jgi:hypothetical protein
MSQVLLLVVAFVVVTAAAAQRLVARRFSARIEGLRLDLLVARGPAREDPSALPPLVRAFAERNGGRRDGPLVVRMKQKAEMRLKPGARFFALTATQDSGTRVPGFVWDARGRMAWVAPLRVLDAYAAGAGQLEVRIAGAIPVARALGPEVDKGEAIRFLAELPWNPDAILAASRCADGRGVDGDGRRTGAGLSASRRGRRHRGRHGRGPTAGRWPRQPADRMDRPLLGLHIGGRLPLAAPW